MTDAERIAWQATADDLIRAARPVYVKPKLVAYEHHAETLAALEAANEQLAIRDAEIEAARADTVALLGLLRQIGGYMRPEDQEAIWAARSRLAAAGVKLDETRRTR